MHNTNRNESDGNYEVRVGHARVRVRGRNDEDALLQARKRLCLEMPRLWDVIQSMEVNDFEIRRV